MIKINTIIIYDFFDLVWAFITRYENRTKLKKKSANFLDFLGFAGFRPSNFQFFLNRLGDLQTV